jgi:glycerol-3-phosphate O-acyltransferase
MGAYFIRRRSRNDLYRRVLARYVRMATDAGVTQAVFPEGGLSLDGGLAPPRLGLLKYIVEDRPAGGPDVVFIPVALNYDRVFEDRILVAAARSGRRRFPARISVVARFVLRQIWLRTTGRYHRHGYAAASFGAPLSLDAFDADHPGAGVEDLGAELMRRLGREVPVLPVPLVADVLLRAEGPLSRDDIARRLRDLVGKMPQAHVHLPSGDMAYAVRFALQILSARRIVRETEAGFVLLDAERDLAAYYARSIAHLCGDRKE